MTTPIFNAPRNQFPLRVLILDDDPNIVTVLSRILTHHKCDALTAGDAHEANSILAGTIPDVAIIDVYLGDQDGLAYVADIRERLPDIGIMVISSDDTATLAKKAIQSGADDFLPKPFAPDELLLRTFKIGEMRQQRRRIIDLESKLERSLRDNLFPEIVTHGDGMRAALNLVEKIAPRDLSALICGESGTGKELVARAIHALSPRKRGPFIELNCAALPPTLVESELFGHERGAFTGAVVARSGKIEQSAGGTLFLDEIGELPLEIQPKLLRALQEKKVTRIGGKNSIQCDFRLISASNRDLMEEVRALRFREDLFYRVAVFPIRLPPLRERPEDIELLLTHFLRQEGLSHVRITRGARDQLTTYSWPGNVRELRNFAQAVTLLSQNGLIDETSVRSYFGSRLDVVGSEPARGAGDGRVQDISARPIRKLADLEREEIIYALRTLKGNVTQAARELGMGRATLYKFLQRHNIDPQRYIKPGANEEKG